MVQLSHLYMTTGKTIALIGQTFVGKVMSLLLNMLSRLVITFLPRSKRLLICNQHLHHFANKGPSSQGYGFSSGHVWMCELDCEESWALKNWCFWTVVLEKTLESPMDFKEIQPVHSKDQPWDFFGRNYAKAETPILWSPDAKSWLTGKDPDAGKDWGQEEKWATEDEIVGWHHWLNGHEFEQTSGDSKRQGSLVCCSPWGHKELNMTEWLNNNNMLHDITETTAVDPPRGNTHKNGVIADNSNIVLEMNRICS